MSVDAEATPNVHGIFVLHEARRPPWWRSRSVINDHIPSSGNQIELIEIVIGGGTVPATKDEDLISPQGRSKR
jgi:hypothetical protein